VGFHLPNRAFTTLAEFAMNLVVRPQCLAFGAVAIDEIGKRLTDVGTAKLDRLCGRSSAGINQDR